ncbi:MAG: hypothetical protein PHO32_01405 [Candidatus Cloacimonetes bacterium]|nr:hypothetical protein [Candidatus Cloacimonadota bacterium]
MKHVFGVMLMVALCSWLGAVSFRLAIGVDTAGEVISSHEALIIGDHLETAHSLSAQMECRKKGIIYGLGVDYQFPRESKKLPENWYTSIGKQTHIPVYGILGYRFETTTKVSPEIIVQNGYNFQRIKIHNHNEDWRYSAKNGAYYAFGFGLNYSEFSLNMLYRVNRFTLKGERLNGNDWENGSDYNSLTRQFNMSLGYKFGG